MQGGCVLDVVDLNNEREPSCGGGVLKYMCTSPAHLRPVCTN